VQYNYFITGTDTEVGKTYVTCLLLKKFSQSGLRCAALKPVASGALLHDGQLRNDDALQLQAMSNVTLPYEDINPYCFAPAIAPHLAAAQAGVSIDMDHITHIAARAGTQVDVLLVEGVGGWQVPLGEGFNVSDLARALGYPVILVVGMRLGCINHALLSAEAICAGGLELAGWVANPMSEGMTAFDDNIVTLQSRLAAPCLGVLQRIDGAAREANVTKLTLP